MSPALVDPSAPSGFTAGETATASAVDARFDVLFDGVNAMGEIVDGLVSEVTSLPGSPVAGQSCLLRVDDAGTYGGPYLWPLRRVGSSWLPIGQAESLLKSNSASLSTSNTGTFVDLQAGNDGKIVLPFDGDWELEGELRMAGQSGDPALVALQVNASSWVSIAGGGVGASDYISHGGSVRATGLAAGDVVKMWFRSGGGTAGFIDNRIRARPIRLT